MRLLAAEFHLLLAKTYLDLCSVSMRDGRPFTHYKALADGHYAKYIDATLP